MTTLLLSSRQSVDNQAIWRIAMQSGWRIERVRGIRLPLGLDSSDIVIYMESIFAHPVAEQLQLTLLDVDEDWLPQLPEMYRLRDIYLTTLRDARHLDKSSFVKPPNDKWFEAQVFETGQSLPADYPDDMSVLVAEPVTFEVEYRCFALDGIILTMSSYVRYGKLSKHDDYSSPNEEIELARQFADQVLTDIGTTLPRAIVLDVGLIKNRGWAVVEANAAWGSGIYGCDPHEVMKVVQQAVVKNTDG